MKNRESSSGLRPQWRQERRLHSENLQDAESAGSDDSEDGLTTSRKIRPVDNLKLKTPIAFQQVPDLGMIPIRKEGMAVCEKCGAIGVKDTYYTKERRFCSLQCAKSFNESPPPVNSVSGPEKRPSIQNVNSTQPPAKKNGQPVEEVHVYSNKKRLQLKGTDSDIYGFDWVEMLSEPGFVAPPLSSFKHAPLNETWVSDVSIGMKVEVENTDTRQSAGTNHGAASGDPQSYWVASVVSLIGYKALLRYEGFGQDDSKDFWVNLAADDVHPVGWCASKGKPLIPPRTIQDKYTEWREFLVRRLTGARSLPYQFHHRIIEACRSRFRTGMILELFDRSRLSSMKVAKIEEIVGRRLRLNYVDSPNGEPFWCHEESPLIHPVGWALQIGHRIQAPPSYLERCQKKVFQSNDSTADLFNEPSKASTKFAAGMKLEAVDPLNLDHICVATVVRVLRNGYLMIQIDRSLSQSQTPSEEESPASDSEDTEDERKNSVFCYHCTSACIAPAGFCEANAINLKAPKGYPGRFRWGDYLRQTKAQSAPESLFPAKEEREHGLRVGMRVEAADLMDPKLICVATIAQVAGRLVRVHFDGWSDEYDQWMDACSPEIYPVGWCELAGYRLEQPVIPVPQITTKKSRTKSKPGPKSSKTKTRSASSTPTTSAPSSASTPTSAQASESEGSANRRPVGRPPGSGVRPTRGSTGRSAPEPTEGARSLRSRKRNHSSSSPSPPPPAPPQPAAPPPQKMKEEAPSTPVNNSAGAKKGPASQWSTSHPNGTENSAVKADTRRSDGVPAAGQSAARPETTNAKTIPRLMDISPAHRREALVGVWPLEWDAQDVAQFLRVNDCAAYCDSFLDAKVDGKTLISLSKDRVLELSNMKVGPSVKIYDLITQLKSRITATQLRQQHLMTPQNR